MSHCNFYDEAEIERNFPLEKCAGCKNNAQDMEDGFYTCRLIVDNVMRELGKGEKKTDEN